MRHIQVLIQHGECFLLLLDVVVDLGGGHVFDHGLHFVVLFIIFEVHFSFLDTGSHPPNLLTFCIQGNLTGFPQFNCLAARLFLVRELTFAVL